MKKNEIEKRAEDVLRDHGLLDMVVDPVRLANQMGVRVFNAKFSSENTHGLLAMRDGQAKVYVKADDQPVRKRFTIAHEIGHFVLHLAGADSEIVDDADSFRTPVDPDATWTTERRKEWEANVFAAALLMNERLVRSVWPDISDVEGMARYFQVSQAAMAIRLENLGIAA